MCLKYMKIELLLFLCFSSFFLGAMDQPEQQKPVIIEEYCYAEPEHPESKAFKLFKYADVTFINDTAHQIKIKPIKKNGTFVVGDSINPRNRKELKGQNLDLIERYEISYSGYEGKNLIITTDELKVRLENKKSAVVSIEIRASWTGLAFAEPKYNILQGAEKRAAKEALEESFIGMHLSLAPQEEKRMLFEELGALQDKSLNPSSLPHEVLDMAPPPYVRETEELERDAAKREYWKNLNLKVNALETKIREFNIDKNLQEKGIDRPHEKLKQIVTSARDHIADYIKVF